MYRLYKDPEGERVFALPRVRNADSIGSSKPQVTDNVTVSQNEVSSQMKI